MPATIDTTLNGGTSVTLQTSPGVNPSTPYTLTAGETNASGNGDIIVNSPLSWTTATTLTLNAYNNIAINASISNTGAGNLILRADDTGSGVGTVTFASADQINFSGSTGTVSIFYNPADNPAGSVINATSYTSPTNYAHDVLTNSSAPNQLMPYMLVNTVYDLQNIENNLSGTYALGTNIDASATAAWNGGAGFVPIANFTGTFNGQGNTISNLVSNVPSDYSVNGPAATAAQIDSAAAYTGVPATTVNPTVTVSPTLGLGISTPSGTNQVGGIQSIASFTAPFTVTATVDATSMNAGLSQLAISTRDGGAGVSITLAQFLTQFCSCGPVPLVASLTYQVSAGPGRPWVNSFFSTGSLTPTYTYTISVNASGTATVSVSSGSYSIGQATASVGTGPFYVVLGEGAGASSSGGASQSYWSSIQVTTAAASQPLGLFGTIGQSGQVSNLVLNNVNMTDNAVFTQGTNSELIGALAGQNAGTISNVTVNGNSSINGLFGSFTAGGLVGQNGIFGQSVGTITGSQAAANVTLGAGFACISNDTCSGPQNAAGGLVGTNVGSITSSSASDAVVVGSDASAGGLVGFNGGSVTSSSATSSVTGSTYAVLGGLVGTNFAGSIDSQLAQMIGAPGLNGVSLNGTISLSNASGTVSGTTGGIIAPDGSGTIALALGGLVGANNGAISGSSATGAVTEAVSVNAPSLYDGFEYKASGIGVALGGLVGLNAGAISNSYATGAVTGSVANPNSTVDDYSAVLFGMGGLVGINVSGTYTNALLQAVGAQAAIGVNANGTIDNSHATGNVTSTVGNANANVGTSDNGGGIVVVAGGLVGINAGPITNDSYTTGTVTGSVAASSTVATNYDGIVLSLGGLVGVEVAGTVTAAEAALVNIPSLSGASVNGSISGSDATGNVSGTVGNIVAGNNAWGVGLLEGGLVAINVGSISNSYATGNISGAVGSVDAGANMTTTTSGGIGIVAGGLIGINAGPIANSYATGTVTGSVASQNFVTTDNTAVVLTLGGLVGIDVAGTLSQAEAQLINEPTLSGISVNGSITQSYASGAVTGTVGSLSSDNASGVVLMEGGLVGVNLGAISQSYAGGVVTGTAGSLDAPVYGGTVLGLGGLVGINAGTISQSYATGDVNGSVSNPNAGNDAIGLSLGGLVGINLGVTVSPLGQVVGDIVQFFGIDPSLSGDVSSLGINGAVTQSYATGSVTGTVDNVNANLSGSITLGLGGLVGLNTGSIAESYATGAVTGGVNGSAVAADANAIDLSAGGLVGINFAGAVTQSEAQSLLIQTILNITDTTQISVADLNADLSWVNFEGTISQSYATGVVSGGTASNVGALVGYNNGTVSSSSALTTTQLQTGLPPGFDPTVWGSNSGVNSGYPYLLWQSPSVPPAPVTYSVANATWTYGTTAALGAVTLTGVPSGATVNATVEVVSSTNSTPFVPVATTAAGTYTEEVVSLSNSNYVIASSGNVNGTLIIKPATLTYSANAASGTYGSAIPALSGTVAGFVNGDSITTATSGTLAFTTTATPSSNVGSYAVTGSGLTPDGNYVFAQALGNATAFTITPASITVTALGGSSTYGASPGNPGLSVTGLQNGQNASVLTGLSNSFGIADTTNAGSYTLTVAGRLTNPNYAVTSAIPGSWTVNPAPVTVTALGGSSTYGASPANSGLSATGLQNGQNASVLTGLSNSFGITDTTNAGSYALTVAGSLTNPNYTLISTNAGTWAVNPAMLYYAANAVNIAPGAAIPSLTGTVTGLVDGQTLASAATGNLSFSTAVTSSSNVGSYAITGSGLTVDNSNYASTVAQAPGNATALTIAAAPTTTVNAPVTQQTTQFIQTASYVEPATPAPVVTIVDPTTSNTTTAANDNTASTSNSPSGNTGGGGTSGSASGTSGTTGGTGTQTNGKHGGNAEHPGTRLVDLKVIPLPNGSGMPPPGETRFVSNEVILQFVPGTTPQQIDDMARHFGLSLSAQQDIGVLGRSVFTFRIGNRETVRDVIAAIEAGGFGAAAQPNYTFGLSQDQKVQVASLGDPAQYIVEKLQLGAVHRISKGDHVVVALIDFEDRHRAAGHRRRGHRRVRRRLRRRRRTRSARHRDGRRHRLAPEFARRRAGCEAHRDLRLRRPRHAGIELGQGHQGPRLRHSARRQNHQYELCRAARSRGRPGASDRARERHRADRRRWK